MLSPRMQAFFQALLSFLFPGDSRVQAIESLTPEDLISRVSWNGKPLPPHIYALFPYRHPVIMAAIRLLKYKGSRKAARLFASAAYDLLLETLSDKCLHENFSDPLLIPLPSSKKRFRERGWNQTFMLAAELKKLDKGKNFSVRTDILAKIRDTPAQAKLSHQARLANLRNCFAVSRAEDVRQRNVILLDDVTTTGSTFFEASKPLLAAGAKNIFCVAIAH